MAAWIPDDPNDYLDAIHQPRPHGWEDDYAPWRHVYAPGFRRLSQTVWPNVNCAQLQQALRLLVPIAVALIPADLPIKVRNVQPSDWSSLPDEQIRDAWDRTNMLFAKVVLCAVSLQILHLIITGQAGSGITIDNLPADLTDVIETLRHLPDTGFNAVRELKIQLATYRFASHDNKFWNDEVLNKPQVASDFRQFALQRHPPFLETFANGDLATIASLKAIKIWYHQRFPNRPLGEIMHWVPDPKRIKAARKETVHEIAVIGPAHP